MHFQLDHNMLMRYIIINTLNIYLLLHIEDKETKFNFITTRSMSLQHMYLFFYYIYTEKLRMDVAGNK